jgi:hypothetical protein
MADKRLLISSITIGHELATASDDSSAQVAISVNSGTNIYTITKNRTSLKSAYFEISELIRDYLTVDFTGTYSNASIQATAVFKMTDDIDGAGNTLYTQTISFYGLAGYSYFEEGANVVISANSGLAQTNKNIYVPDNLSFQIPTFSFTNIASTNFGANVEGSISIGGTTVFVNRICQPKYEPYKITFINKFGALEDIYFSLVRRDSTSVKSETFKRNIVNSTGGYTPTDHVNTTFNVVGKDRFTMNTAYVSEDYNETMEQLLLSEKIWCTSDLYSTPVVRPVKIVTKTLEKKTRLNDKLIQFEMEFEYANDKINNVR